MSDKEKVWDIARKLVLSEADGGISTDKLLDLFGTSNYYKIIKDMSVEEVENVIDDYYDIGEYQVLDYEVGNIIEFANSGKLLITKTSSGDDTFFDCIDENGGCYSVHKNDIKDFKVVGSISDKKILTKALLKLNTKRGLFK